MTRPEPDTKSKIGSGSTNMTHVKAGRVRVNMYKNRLTPLTGLSIEKNFYVFVFVFSVSILLKIHMQFPIHFQEKIVTLLICSIESNYIHFVFNGKSFKFLINGLNVSYYGRPELTCVRFRVEIFDTNNKCCQAQRAHFNLARLTTLLQTIFVKFCHSW